MTSASKIETLTSPISEREFFDRFVKQRKPVKCAFVLEELLDATTKWKDNEYLRSKAGTELILAEKRNSKSEHFGIAHKEQMEFGKFLDLLSESEEERYYLTAQQIEESEFGPKALFTSPLNSELMADIALKPSILRKLELYQINVWFGHSSKGSASRLHHDYHDNLYVVVRGRKQFELFAPKWVHSLYPHGLARASTSFCNVFQNGLISYSDDFREDGASKMSVALWNGDHDDVDDELELLLNEKIKEMEDDENEEILEPPPKRQRLSNDECDEYDDEQKEEEHDPPSFSQIDLAEDDDIIISKYPKYAEALKEKQVVTLKEGEMLYLPVGWFHNVTSFSNEHLKSHFAINWWFHPMLKSGRYPDEFWKEYNRETFDCLK